jgi:hypothetical protein
MLPVFSQSEADLTACFVQDMAVLLDTFSEKDTSGKQSLQQMLSSDQEAFSRASIRVLANATVSAGARYVVHLLRKHNLLLEALADPRGSMEDAVAAARVIPRIGSPLDSDLENLLSATLSRPRSAAQAARVLRLLNLLEAASPQPRFYLFHNDLMDYPDSTIRSRSAFLSASTSKSVALVGRLMLDDDPRVQANAVEALWTFEAADARPLLLTACRSRTARVAANSVVGLYRIGDVSGLRLLFEMARQEDPDRRTSAAWAMGETGDPRFLPFLAAWFSRSSGNERTCVLQALGRIRRHVKSLAEVIETRVWLATMVGDSRHLVLSLRSPDQANLSDLKPTQFAIWEGETLVEDYEIAAWANPALAISGFVLPRFVSTADPYAIAVHDAISSCLRHKRPDDLWRLDRYLPEPRNGEAGPLLEKAALPYDESLLGPSAKTQHRGFLTSADVLRRIVESPGPRERAADDAIAAFDRQSDAMIKFSGKRRLFLFLSPESGGRLVRHVSRLKSFVANERIAIHGLAPKGAPGFEEFDELCLASEGGSFASVPPEEVAGEVERIYAQSINCFEVTYRAPERAVTDASIQVHTAKGCGRASFSLA